MAAADERRLPGPLRAARERGLTSIDQHPLGDFERYVAALVRLVDAVNDTVTSPLASQAKAVGQLCPLGQLGSR